MFGQATTCFSRNIRSRAIRGAALCMAATLVMAGCSSDQPAGTLDKRYGPDKNGFVNVDLGEPADLITDIATEDDFTLAAASSGNNAGLSKAFALRLSNKGTPDSYGTNGRSEISIPGARSTGVSSVAIDSKNRGLFAGLYLADNSPRAYVKRFKSDGAPDVEFGEPSGIAALPPGVNIVYWVGASADGKTIVLTRNAGSPVLYRFNEDGSPDNTFGPAPDTNEFPIEALAQSGFTDATVDGDNLWLVGEGPNGPTAVRIDLAGANGSGAVAMTKQLTGLEPSATAFQPLFSICNVPGGGVAIAAAQKANIRLVRLNNNGEPEPSFGNGGVATTTVGGQPFDIVFGKGSFTFSAVPSIKGQSTQLARYRLDGSPDTDFGLAKNGTVTADLGGGRTALLGQVAATEDGKILAAGGQTTALPATDGAIARFN